MIPTSELNQKLIDILQNVEVISENSVIEFKAVPHSKNFETELFKDVLALANSYERPNEDRWLIYGVDDKNRILLGVDRSNPDVLDDASYHQKFKKIHPDLHIEFMTIPARYVTESFGPEKIFAAFYIPCECMNEIYEMEQSVSDREAKNGKIRTLEPGTSFVRNGSSTDPLFEHHRTRIRELSQSRIVQTPPVGQTHEEGCLTKSADILLLLGSWDEANRIDREMLARISGEPYSLTVKSFNQCLMTAFSA